MSETLNVNVLVAAKEEYTKQLINTLQTPIYDIIKDVYLDSQKQNVRRDISYSNFQRELKQVPNWASFKLEEKLSEINKKIPYLMDLITAIFVSHVKILACVRLKSDSKSIKIKVPNLNTFLHKIIISISENIYYNPHIIHDEKEKIYTIVNTCITETIANQIPIEYILNEYLSGVFEEDEEPVNLSQPPFEEPTNQYNEDAASVISDYEQETRDIPIVPIEKTVNKMPPPQKLDELPIEKNEEPIESFEDLKEKKDAIKTLEVNKKDDIEDYDSEEDISDEEVSDDEEKESKEKETPTLF
tara:strand:+ start:584 stop:1486 length:903 start_codon:yes stop_codon:yes gene_type:complete